MLGTSIIINKKKPGPPVKLSLVALMDIFTILVFFLLLNSGESQTLEDAKFVKLPDSKSKASPHSELVIHLGNEELWLDNRKLVALSDLPKDDKALIEPLATALKSFSAKLGALNEHEQNNGLGVTIMADRAVPYETLKSVMATCRSANFRQISLAVNRVAAPALNSPSPSEGADESAELSLHDGVQ